MSGSNRVAWLRKASEELGIKLLLPDISLRGLGLQFELLESLVLGKIDGKSE